MILCLDIGNSNLVGGVFKDKLLLQFRHDTKKIGTSDELGIFLRSVLRENDIDYKEITKIGIASVVPHIDYTLRATCRKYICGIDPVFLNSSTATNIKIARKNQHEIGADLIAGAIAAKSLFANKNILVFDFGTATTACFINKDDEFIGASIAPGLRLMMESLHGNTAKLQSVNIVAPKSAIGTHTKTALQSGVYYTQLGFAKQIIKCTKEEFTLDNEDLVVVATGGFSYLFASSKAFDHIIPELVLLGIKTIL
jgi:type III pantothenate kinase